MKRLHVESSLFVLPKEGADVEECEDAAMADDAAFCYAVADGATEAFDAGRWARRLAEGWVRASPPPTSADEFRKWVGAQGELLQAEWGGTSLPWYVEEKRRAGSFAAFVGLRFESIGGDSANTHVSSLHWRAVGLGDSCLVQRRGGAVILSLPLDSSNAFNSSPPLVPSEGALQRAALARTVFREGEAAPGDIFFLLSDAVAAWFFGACEQRSSSLAEFDSLVSSSENERLAEFINRERRACRLKDDDVAIIRIKVVDA